MKITIKTALTCLPVLLLLASCSDDEGVFSRENDSVLCDCTEQSIPQNILCDGEWKADDSGVNWITISPERGNGNGVDFDHFYLNVAYNSGGERSGTVYLVYNGRSYPITVTQEECNFAYGEPRISGTLFVDMENTASIMLPYSGASGEESVEISAMVTGEAAAGLTVNAATYSSFVKGAGELTIPVGGAATTAGRVTFELTVDGTSVGTVSTTVISDPNAAPAGLPVGWNFYAEGMTAAQVRGSSYDYSWTVDATNPAADTNPLEAHRVLPTYGNPDAYLTASATIGDNANYSFNPGIQIRGMVMNDYFLFVIPVQNIGAQSTVSVEASVGGAGSAAGYYALEYSSDGTTWRLADGSTMMDVFGSSAAVHYYSPTENASNPGRTSYDKETDLAYRKYEFPLTGIETIYAGNLYLRMRVCLNRRINGSETTNTIAANTWADLKGFEVALIDD